jgi:O-antigen/teichoic acid export membrane protein
MAGAAFSTVLISLGQTLLLSRLLEPRDFGLVGMMWVVLSFVDLVADLGLSLAVVRWPEWDAEWVESIFGATLLSGGALTVGIFASRGLVAELYREPRLRELTVWLLASFFFSCAGKVFLAVLQRNLRFDALAKIDTLASLAGAVVSVTLAARGWGAESLACGSGVAALARTAQAYGWSLQYWKPRLALRWRDLAGVFSFGGYRMGENLANYVSANVDYLIVGRVWGAEALGLYRFAYELVVRPLAIVNPIFNSVALPVFSQRQNDNAALRKAFLEVLGLIAAIDFPLLVGLAVVAPWLVPELFGAKWTPAAPLMQILTGMALLKAVGNPAGAILVAKGHMRTAFLSNLCLAALAALTFLAVARFGVAAIAWAWTGVILAVQVGFWRPYYAGTIGLRPGEYLRALWPALLAVSGMGLGVWGLRGWGWGVWGLGEFPRDGAIGPRTALALLVAAGAALYCGLFAWLGREQWRQWLRQSGAAQGEA